MVRAPRAGEHATEAAFAGTNVEDELAVYVPAFLQHDVVEEHGPAGVTFVDEANVFGGEGRPAGWVARVGHRILLGEKGRPLCTSDAS